MPSEIPGFSYMPEQKEKDPVMPTRTSTKSTSTPSSSSCTDTHPAQSYNILLIISGKAQRTRLTQSLQHGGYKVYVWHQIEGEQNYIDDTSFRRLIDFIMRNTYRAAFLFASGDTYTTWDSASSVRSDTWPRSMDARGIYGLPNLKPSIKERVRLATLTICRQAKIVEKLMEAKTPWCLLTPHTDISARPTAMDMPEFKTIGEDEQILHTRVSQCMFGAAFEGHTILWIWPKYSSTDLAAEFRFCQHLKKSWISGGFAKT